MSRDRVARSEGGGGGGVGLWGAGSSWVSQAAQSRHVSFHTCIIAVPGNSAHQRMQIAIAISQALEAALSKSSHMQGAAGSSAAHIIHQLSLHVLAVQPLILLSISCNTTFAIQSACAWVWLFFGRVLCTMQASEILAVQILYHIASGPQKPTSAAVDRAQDERDEVLINEDARPALHHGNSSLAFRGVLESRPVRSWKWFPC